MIQTQFPYIDASGKEFPNLIRTWSDDETKILLQVETGYIYEEAIDLYPCRFTYQEVDRPVDPEPEEDSGE